MCANDGGMTSKGSRGYVPITRYEPCLRELNLQTAETRTADDRMLEADIILFSFQYKTYSHSTLCIYNIILLHIAGMLQILLPFY